MGGRGGQVFSFGESVEHSIRLAVGVVLVTKTVVFTGQIPGMTESRSELALALCIVTCVTIAGARCLTGRAGLLDLGLCASALVTSFTLAGDITPLPGAANSPITHLVEPMLLAVVVSQGRRFGLLLASISLFFVVLRAQTGGTDGLIYGLQEATFLTGVAAAAYLLVSRMRGASARADAALLTYRMRRADRRDLAENEATTFLHDDLVPTLLAVSMLPDAAETRAASTASLNRLINPDGGSATGALLDQLRAVAAATTIRVTVTARDRSRRPPPPEVEAAFVGATREALRNAARHSGVESARVSVARRLGRIEVAIEDDGVGFDPSRTGVGLRTSVVQRMRAVGGDAMIGSGRRAGTTVSLTWRDPILRRLLGTGSEPYDLVRQSIGDPGRVAALVCGALASGYLTSAALLVPSNGPQPRSAAAAIAALLTVAMLCRALSRGPLSRPWLVAAALIPAAMVFAALPAIPVARLGGLDSWVVEVGSLPILVAAWSVGIRVLCLMLVPSAVVIGTTAVSGGLAPADLPHLLLVQPVNAFFVALIIRGCRTAGRAIALSQSPDRPASDFARRLHDLLGHNYLAISAALAVNAGRGEGSTDAGRLAHAARDCLYLPGDRFAPLRTEFDALRQRGVQLESIVRGPPEPHDGLTRLLQVLHRCDVAVVRIASTRAQVSVVVVPGVSPTDRSRITAALELPWTVVFDTDATVLRWDRQEQIATQPDDRRHAPG
ncbi:hypothetical protein F0U44_05650 [Nocardioides humilatus]|uniref:Histidine kinase/HSP90-like ATPase domain-containing protein n=1 Tax=Nocardioides humilatus TaxID=2607660 RepID=A0A5B1LLV6_9ACTN|nr:ATP-binding protein [Nocardioides humilatus]KAA1421755.1 hypothetical protein F0U44_05650 [Nocardioides humilatus]